jgi:nicotinamide-nucleotide amidase
VSASEVVAAAKRARMTIATAESCTGGMIAAALTNVAGSSAVFGYGFVTYANAAKVSMLGVDAAVLSEEGAVSEAVARAMAEGALLRAGAHIAVAVTGIAGPDGGSGTKPVGTIWFGLARRDMPTVAARMVFAGDRAAVRAATVDYALGMVLARLG